MSISRRLLPILFGLSIAATVPSVTPLTQAQQEDAASTLSEISPEMLAKVRALAQILEQGLKEGDLSESDVQQGLTNGQLGEKLKQLSPEATQLMNELSNASRQGKVPGEESLLPLLEGLGNSTH